MANKRPRFDSGVPWPSFEEFLPPFARQKSYEAEASNFLGGFDAAAPQAMFSATPPPTPSPQSQSASPPAPALPPLSTSQPRYLKKRSESAVNQQHKRDRDKYQQHFLAVKSRSDPIQCEMLADVARRVVTSMLKRSSKETHFVERMTSLLLLRVTKEGGRFRNLNPPRDFDALICWLCDLATSVHTCAMTLLSAPDDQQYLRPPSFTELSITLMLLMPASP
eukprot:m.90062 g.90062  ORF g.90062 m.90062 type:complete len:222 (-) comp13678_c0_seq2:234-899(-)